MIPYVNASLNTITAPGSAPDYDDPGSAGTARWTGFVGIYVSERLVEVESPGRVDELLKTRVEIPYNTGKLIKRGDKLTWLNHETNTTSTRIAENLIYSPRVGRVQVLVEDA